MAMPTNAVHVPVDFQRDSLSERLRTAGFDPATPAVFAWLGVVPYLHRAAVDATLRELAYSAAGSVLLMDYSLPRNVLPAHEQLEFDSLAARVAGTGEPFQTWLEPVEVRDMLARHRWHVRHDLGRVAINDRYFAGRMDGLAVLRNGARLALAELVAV